ARRPRGGAEPPRRAGIEPRFEATGQATAPPLRSAAEEDDEDVDVGTPVGAPAGTQATRKPKPTPRPPRRSSGGYVLPSLELLAAPKAIGRAILSADALQTNATALEGVL